MTFPDWQLRPHGTAAAYRRHLRREGKPVRCPVCLEGEALRQQEWKDRTAYNAARRQRYADAVAAGLSKAEALRVRDRRAAA
jgi:hypothetical protein